MANGWTRKEILRRAGLADDKRLVTAERVRPATAERIARIYEELAAYHGPSRQTRSAARTRGYPPPLAWDDIDNPNEKPKGLIRLSAQTPCVPAL